MLATQTLVQAPAKNMRIRVEGKLPAGATAKDIVLKIIGTIGTAGGTGYVIEYAGEAIRNLSMEGRMTICNMSIEGGARAVITSYSIHYTKLYDFFAQEHQAALGVEQDRHVVELADRAQFEQRVDPFGPPGVVDERADLADLIAQFLELLLRITSYNVCYTKLLRTE